MDARVEPELDVRAQVENAVRATNRQRLQEEWLASLREQIEVRELVTLGGLPGEDAAFTVPVPGADEAAGETGEAEGEAAEDQADDAEEPAGEGQEE